MLDQALDLPDTLSDAYCPGDTLDGKYKLRRRVGRGAMGSVWIATNVALEADVAIKLICRRVGMPGLAGRLLHEARSAAMLSHAAIVRVFDFGMTSVGDPYLVMEALQGETLAALLARERRLSSERAVALMLPIISGMHAAHLKGIVHRDLKPDNIVLTELGGGRVQPKVVDFGVARTIWIDQAHSTRAAVWGTPGYMAPEQAMGSFVDRRADVWAYCACLFEAVSGALPISATNGADALRAVIEDPVRSLSEYAYVDEGLAEIVDRGLRKDPAERWQTMLDLADALATWLASRGVHADASGVSLRGGWLQPSPNATAPTARIDSDAPLPQFMSSSLPLPLTKARRQPVRPHRAPGRRGMAPTIEKRRAAGARPRSETAVSPWRRRASACIAFGFITAAALSAAVTGVDLARSAGLVGPEAFGFLPSLVPTTTTPHATPSAARAPARPPLEHPHDRHGDTMDLDRLDLEVIDGLNRCLKAELTAVETYDLAVEQVSDPDVGQALMRLRGDHQLRAEQLRERVRAFGVAPLDKPGALGLFAKLVQSGADLLGDRAAVSTLAEFEDWCLGIHTSALATPDPATREFIETHLVSAQRRTHEMCRALANQVELAKA